MTDVVIRTEGLVKDYGDVRALAGVDLEVRHGEVFGFLGPNGAGKSTAIRVLLDLLRPTAGRAEVFGVTPESGDGVVQAFMHRPDLLVLDEPTSGLDPLLQREFLDLVVEARDRGATVFMSSHVLSEVEEIAGRVAIIRAGRIVDVDDVPTLRHRAGQLVELRFGEPVDPPAVHGP